MHKDLQQESDHPDDQDGKINEQGALSQNESRETTNPYDDILHLQKLESLGLLASGMAHDFNNLLMAILGNADLALMTLTPHSPIREHLEEIGQATKRASDICRQILAFNGKEHSLRDPIDLNKTLEEMNCLLATAIPKRILLRYNLTDDPLPIIVDTSRLLQLIAALVTNAAAAIPERGGTVALSTGIMDCDRSYLDRLIFGGSLAPGRYIFLEVSDTGRGMSREMIERLFDPAFVNSRPGRGLGLAASREIVRIYGGAIKVYSEPGRGTTVKILFPVGASVAAETGEVQDKNWLGSGTILVADDEDHIRRLVKAMLDRTGFNVLLAADGTEAIAIYRELAEQIDCVLLDLTMPHLGGEETFQELRRIREDVKVIMSSGYSEREVVERFLGKGLSGFIQKPYQIQALVDTIRKVIEG